MSASGPSRVVEAAATAATPASMIVSATVGGRGRFDALQASDHFMFLLMASVLVSASALNWCLVHRQPESKAERLQGVNIDRPAAIVREGNHTAASRSVHPELESLTPSLPGPRTRSRVKDLVTGLTEPQADDSDSDSTETVLQADDSDSDYSVDPATMYINVNTESNRAIYGTVF
eukprot:3546180-Prymnesium_polylepis.1